MYHNEQRSAKRAFWRKMCDRQKESGLSVKEFCAREQIAPASFYWWKKRLVRNEEFDSVSGFVEIKATGDGHTAFTLLKIIVPEMCILEVQEEISPEYIARLVQKLREVR